MPGCGYATGMAATGEIVKLLSLQFIIIMLGRSGIKCFNLRGTYSDSADVAMSLQVANESNVYEPHLTHSSSSSSVLVQWSLN